MTKPEIAEILAHIAARWSWRDIPAHTAQAWYEDLEDIRFDDAMRAVKAHASEEDFPPSIAAIRRRCGKGKLGDEDYAQLAEQRKIARGTINVFGVEAARGIIGTERFDRLFPEHVPQPQTALEAAIERELHPRSELGAGE